MNDKDRLLKQQQSERLKHIRQIHGMMQYEMAEKLNYKRSSYNQVEKGVYKLNSQALLVLKMMFNINPKWYLHGEGEMHLEKKTYSADDWKAKYQACRAEVGRLNKIIDGLIGGGRGSNP